MNGLALLDASGWSAPGGFSRSTIRPVGVHDVGHGPQLYGVDTNEGIVWWDGEEWLPLGTGPEDDGIGSQRPSPTTTAPVRSSSSATDSIAWAPA